MSTDLNHPAERGRLNRKRVAITGIGVLSPIGCGRQRFLEALRAGESGVSEITAFDTSGYPFSKGCEVRDFEPGRFFDRRELRRMDRASQFVLAAAAEAVADAGCDRDSLRQERGAVVMGTTLGGMRSGEVYFQKLIGGRRRPAGLVDFLSSAASDQIAIRYGINGPNLSFSTACSSGLHAIGHAFDLVRSGMVDFAIAGAHDTMAQMTAAGFGRLRCITNDKIRPFDKNRSGFCLGEGCGIVVLEDHARALRRKARIHSEILGYGASSDAYHMTAPHKEGEGAALAMQLALDDAGFDKQRISYINAHGTATPHNDLAETIAIKRVFLDQAPRIPVSSIKAMIGHTLGAAGMLEAIASILCCAGGFIPPTINYETPDPKCDLDYVPNASRTGSFPHVLCNSFGFGGNNASVLFQVV